jgi:hypothetical protein
MAGGGAAKTEASLRLRELSMGITGLIHIASVPMLMHLRLTHTLLPRMRVYVLLKL